jgi:hypothetical protein
MHVLGEVFGRCQVMEEEGYGIWWVLYVFTMRIKALH